MVFGIETGLLIRWLGFTLGALLVYQGVSGYYMRRSRVARTRRAHRWVGATVLAIAGTHAVIALVLH